MARYALGTVLIIGVVILWAIEIKLLQHIHNAACKPGIAAVELIAPLPLPPPPPPLAPCAPQWNKPFAIGFALKSLFALFLPIALLWRRTSYGTALPGSLRLTRHTVLCCGGLTLLVQGASVSWVASIPLTSASANSAIYQSSCALAYLFSLPLLKEETLSASKSMAVLLAIGGVFLVIFASRGGDAGDDADASQTAASAARADDTDAAGGDLLVFGSAAFYALKEVLYKRWLSGEDEGVQEVGEAWLASPRTVPAGRADFCANAAEGAPPRPQAVRLAHTSPGAVVPSASASASASCVAAAADHPASTHMASPTPIADAVLCVGLLGAWCCVTAPVWLALLHFTGIERVAVPPAETAVGYAVVACMMALYQILLFSCIAVTSPTFAAVGQLLVSPVSMLWDALSLHFVLPPIALVGTAAIALALVLVLAAPALDARLALACRGQGTRAGAVTAAAAGVATVAVATSDSNGACEEDGQGSRKGRTGERRRRSQRPTLLASGSLRSDEIEPIPPAAPLPDTAPAAGAGTPDG